MRYTGNMPTVSRLIETFTPSNYNLSLTLEREARRFHGTVVITGNALSESTSLRLHSKDLTITTALIDGSTVNTHHDEHDELVLEASQPLAAGEHIITVQFSGDITDTMNGLYPCYFTHNGQKKELLATQFESHYARQAFPCIDEPAAKATFDLTLTTEKSVTVLGNQPVKDQREENNLLVTTFVTTPRMSTYLLAWVVGELQHKKGISKSGVDVGIWATPAQSAESLDFALDIATRTIDFFDDFFGVPYPLPKSDHVALPDFSAGAMENWGLITYRETALLADPKTSSIAGRRYAASVIAHELSHQWFGNLVTMQWWNDLWLNESFANMMEYFAIDALEPTWNMWLEHASHETLYALRRDSLDGVQAIQTDVSHPDEISTLFDGAIVYAKGGRLIRMLQQYIGDEAFKEGLRAYFKTHAYKNTVADDLWQAFTDASGKDVKTLMDAWITQPGFPVVHVAQEGTTVRLAQERFFVGPHQPSSSVWPIPLRATCGEMPVLFSEKELAVTRHHTTPLLLNSGGGTHFIAHYSDVLLQKILATLSSLPDVDKLHFLHEQTLLAQAGSISTAELIPLLDYYKSETAEAIWDIIAVTINELKKFVEDDEAAEHALKKLVGTLAKPHYARLGWAKQDNEPEDDTKLRATIVSLMVYSEDASAIETALRLFAEHSLEELDGELRPHIIASVVRFSNDPSAIDRLIEQYKQTHLSELRDDIAGGLTATKDPHLIQRLLELIRQPAIVRTQDFLHWLIWLIRNRYGRELTWQWVQDNWPWLEETFKGDSHYDMLPRYTANALRSTEHLASYKAFFEPKEAIPALTRNITIGVGEIEGRIALLARDTENVTTALKKSTLSPEP